GGRPARPGRVLPAPRRKPRPREESRRSGRTGEAWSGCSWVTVPFRFERQPTPTREQRDREAPQREPQSRETVRHQEPNGPGLPALHTLSIVQKTPDRL